MQNDLKKWIKPKIAPFFSAKQFTSSSFFNVAGSTTMTIKKPGKTDFSRSISFLHSHKDFIFTCLY